MQGISPHRGNPFLPEVSESRRACPTGRPNDEQREFLLVGSPETIVSQLRRYDGVGITEFNVAFYHRDVKTALNQIRLFAKEVMPVLRTGNSV